MNPYKQHQINCAEFFDKIAKDNKAITCHHGCYKCCVTNISVFGWEAKLIEEWFADLDPHEQNDLKQKWQQDSPLEYNMDNRLQKACAFLTDHQCTIYEARPVICRTQGLALYLDEQIDSCPLNYTEQNPQKNEALDLNRVNAISAILQNKFSAEFPEEKSRISLNALKEKLINLR